MKNVSSQHANEHKSPTLPVLQIILKKIHQHRKVTESNTQKILWTIF